VVSRHFDDLDAVSRRLRPAALLATAPEPKTHPGSFLGAGRDAMPLALLGSGNTDDAYFSEAPMDAPRRVFQLIQSSGDWYWRLDIRNDEGLIGPFMSRDEAQKDARETLGIAEGER
jgi:hypothetical protein